MNRATFFKHFDLLADQPDAVAKMREFVLELAVRGKLVSNGAQADKDGAWTKFCAEATALNSELSPAFNVPNHWRWARLEDVAVPCGQKKPDARFTYVEVGAIDNERGVIKDDVEVVEPENAPSRARKLVAQNSVIYSTVRPYLKNIAIVDRKFSPSAIVSTAFAVLHPMDFLQSRYLYHWLRSRPFQSDVESKMKGVAYPAISDSELWQCLIPVPPPTEQRRIVSKVDELMALCEELEQRQQARQHASGVLQQSAMHHLLAAREPQTFVAAWQRVRDHFHLLHDTPDALPQLRQAIFQLAVQGRLVPQNPKDEPTHALLKRITSETKGPLNPGEIDLSQLPFDLPNGWLWVEAEDLCRPTSIITYGVLKPVWVERGVPTVRVQDMQDGKIVVEGIGQCSHERAAKFSKTTLEPGDLLIAKDGATLGKTGFVPSSLAGGNITQHVLRFPISHSVQSSFVRLVVDSPHGQHWMLKETKGVALPGVNVGDFRRMPVPLPPLAEQKRIVARVEELLRWCDTLEAQLHQTRTLGAHLLASTLHHLLAA